MPEDLRTIDPHQAEGSRKLIIIIVVAPFRPFLLVGSPPRELAFVPTAPDD